MYPCVFSLHPIKTFQRIFWMLHFIVLVQAYLTFQAGPAKTGAGRKPCGFKALGEGPIGAKNFQGGRDPPEHHMLI